MSSLEARVAELEAQLELMNLEARYARTWDSGRAEEWAAGFTEDGVFERVAVEGMPAMRVEGRAALRAFCEEFNRDKGFLHLLHSHELEVDGDTAEGTVFFECRRIGLGEARHQGLISGYYDVAYVCTPAGWRMRRRLERQVFRREESFYGIGEPRPRG